MKEKSVLEQALLQIETLEEAVKTNAKGILASTMKQELNDLLKESTEEDEEMVDDVNEQPTPDEEEENDMSDDVTSNDDEEEISNDDDDTDLDNEPEEDSDDMSSDDFGGSLESDDEFGPDEDMPTDDFEYNDESEDDEDVLDMTGASNDEVLKVFKAMKPEDGIIVKKDGNNVELETGEDDFIIKLDEKDEEMSEEFSDDESFEDEIHETEESEDETIYEIDLDDEEGEETDVEESTHEVEATEAARTKWNPHGDKGEAKRAGLPSKKMFKAGSGKINEEVEKLRKQNSEYKKALVLFKDKLNEVAVFNANLAYAVRLFTEHTTTKQEKLDIMKRFDTVSTLNESKNLFKTMKTELETKKPITETVAEKISMAPKTSSSTEVLSESKVYENPQFKRVKDLMSKMQ